MVISPDGWDIAGEAFFRSHHLPYVSAEKYQFRRPALTVPQPRSVVSGPVPGREGPNSVHVCTRYQYQHLHMVHGRGIEPLFLP